MGAASKPDSRSSDLLTARVRLWRVFADAAGSLHESSRLQTPLATTGTETVSLVVPMTLRAKDMPKSGKMGKREPPKKRESALTQTKLAEVLSSPDGLPALHRGAVTFAATCQQFEVASTDVEHTESVQQFLFELLGWIRDWQKTIAPSFSLAEFIARIEALPTRVISDYVEAVTADSGCSPPSSTSEPLGGSVEATLENEDVWGAVGAVHSTDSSSGTERSFHKQSTKRTRQRLRRASGSHALGSLSTAALDLTIERARDTSSNWNKSASASDQEADHIDDILEQIAKRGRKMPTEIQRRSRTHALSDSDSDRASTSRSST
jgi:hypothetical protein